MANSGMGITKTQPIQGSCFMACATLLKSTFSASGLRKRLRKPASSSSKLMTSTHHCYLISHVVETLSEKTCASNNPEDIAEWQLNNPAA